MIGGAVIARAVAALAFLGAVGAEAPRILAIAVLLLLFGLQVAFLARAVRWTMRATGRDFRPAVRRLAIEVAAAVMVNAGVVGGSLWAGWHIG